MSIRVVLTPEQELEAATIGFQRQFNNVRDGRQPRHRGGSLWGGHIEAACSESAGHIGTGLPWTGKVLWEDSPRPLPDLGDDVEVKWRWPGATHFFIAEDHPDEWRYLLVRGFAPEFELAGYITGAEAKRHGEWMHKYPERDVYRVPLAALRPAEELIVPVSKRRLDGSETSA